MIAERRHLGIATLEAACMVIIAGAIVGGAAATVDYLVQTSKIRTLSERSLTDTAVRTLSLSTGLEGDVVVTVNHEGLATFITESLRKAESAMGDHNGGSEQPSHYFIEMGYGIAEIDPRSGVMRGIRSNPQNQWQRGEFNPEPYGDRCPNLSLMFSELRSHLRPDEQGGMLSQYAVPDARFGLVGEVGGYLPEVVVVGMRVLKDLRGSFGGDAYAAIGGIPVTASCSMTVMRGDVQ